jgi:hypothetical protein
MQIFFQELDRLFFFPFSVQFLFPLITHLILTPESFVGNSLSLSKVLPILSNLLHNIHIRHQSICVFLQCQLRILRVILRPLIIQKESKGRAWTFIAQLFGVLHTTPTLCLPFPISNVDALIQFNLLTFLALLQ